MNAWRKMEGLINKAGRGFGQHKMLAICLHCLRRYHLWLEAKTVLFYQAFTHFQRNANINNQWVTLATDPKPDRNIYQIFIKVQQRNASDHICGTNATNRNLNERRIYLFIEDYATSKPLNPIRINYLQSLLFNAFRCRKCFAKTLR